MASERPGRDKPDANAVETTSEATAARKRDRDSQFGPTTPGSDDTGSTSGPLGDNVGTSHTAKKNRVISRDNSSQDLVKDESGQQGFRSTVGSVIEDDLDITPPGTPTVATSGVDVDDTGADAIGGRSRATTVRSSSAARTASVQSAADITPPGSPAVLGNARLGARSRPETSRVKEMRERVQEMTTGDGVDTDSAKGSGSDIASDDLNSTTIENIEDTEEPAPVLLPTSSASSSRTSSPPPPSVQEAIAELPESAAEAEAEKHLRGSASNGEEDMVEEPEDVLTPPASGAGSARAAAISSMEESDSYLPPSQPLTRPAVAALGRSSTLIPPPSPASSIRAETGSNAGESDYIGGPYSETGATPGRPSASRMSSMTSLRSVNTSQAVPGSLSANQTSHHLHLHSSLPKSASSLDVASDALSDISTEANPPGTPRPLQDADAPSTPLANVAGVTPLEENGTDPPPPTPSGAETDAPASTNAPTSSAGASTGPAAPPVQANFGRPTSSFTTSSPSSSAKGFVNPFSSFGSSTSSPFASSSSSPFGSAKTSAPATSSNLSTAKPFGPASGFGGVGSSASPFATAGTSSKSPFATAPSTTTAAGAADAGASDVLHNADDNSEGDAVGTRAREETSQEKIFSSQNEVHMLTGEEDEYTHCTVPRAKLYVLDGSEWKERGVGQLRVNSKADPATDKLSVRLVMRSEAVHRLILNISLFPGMSVTLAQDKFVRLSAFEDGKLRHFTMRIQNPQQSKELYDQINEMLELLPNPATGSAGQSANRRGEEEV